MGGGNETKNGGSLSSLSSSLSVLGLFTEQHPTWSADAINEALGFSRPTGYRYVRELVNSGLVARIAPGTLLDGFTVGELVHTGGMAVLYRASHPDHTIPLIMKVPRLAEGDDPEAIVGFQEHGPTTFQGKLEGDGQAHRAAADHGYGRGRRLDHQKGIATEENLGSR